MNKVKATNKRKTRRNPITNSFQKGVDGQTPKKEDGLLKGGDKRKTRTQKRVRRKEGF